MDNAKTVSPRRAAIAVVLLLGCAWIGSRGPLYIGADRPGVDSGVFTAVAWHMLGGHAPYRDAWDHKPPMIHLLNAAALWADQWWTGDEPSIHAVRQMERIFGAAAAALAFGLAWLIFHRAALAAIASVLLTLMLFHPLIFEGGNLTEEYAVTFMLAGMAAAVASRQTASRRASHALTALCGSALGCAVLTKEPFLLTALPWAVLAVWPTPWRGRLALVYRSISLMLGAAVPLAAVVVYFLAHGAMSDWMDVIAFNVAYAGADPERKSLPLRVLTNLGRALGNFSLICWPALLAAMLGAASVALGKRRRRMPRGAGVSPVSRMGVSPMQRGHETEMAESAGAATVAHHECPATLATGGTSVGLMDETPAPRAQRTPVLRFSRGLGVALLADCALAVLATSLSGRGYGHYHLQLVPSMALLAVMGAAFVAYRVAAMESRGRAAAMAALAVLIGLPLAIGETLSAPGSDSRLAYLTGPLGGFARRQATPIARWNGDALTETVRERTAMREETAARKAADRPRVWVANSYLSYVYLHAGVLSPTPRLYVNEDLFVDTPASTADEKYQRLLDDLRDNPPDLILLTPYWRQRLEPQGLSDLLDPHYGLTDRLPVHIDWSGNPTVEIWQRRAAAQ